MNALSKKQQNRKAEKRAEKLQDMQLYKNIDLMIKVCK